jgi:uncharacterized protein
VPTQPRDTARPLARLAAASLLLLATKTALALPVLEGPVTDLVDVLSPADEERISQILVAHRDATGVQIAVLLVGSTEGEPLEDLAIETAENWRGGDPARDTGALIVVATEERRVRLELGYGLESHLTDAEAHRLLERARDLLERDAWAEAVLGLVWGLVDATADSGPQAAAEPPRRDHVDRDFPEWWLALGLAIVTLWFIWIGGRKRRRQLRQRKRTLSPGADG